MVTHQSNYLAGRLPVIKYSKIEKLSHLIAIIDLEYDSRYSNVTDVILLMAFLSDKPRMHDS
jgi:hypothetical protein